MPWPDSCVASRLASASIDCSTSHSTYSRLSAICSLAAAALGEPALERAARRRAEPLRTSGIELLVVGDLRRLMLRGIGVGGRHRWSGGLAEGSRARQRLPGRRRGFHFRCPARGAVMRAIARSSRAGEAASPRRGRSWPRCDHSAWRSSSGSRTLMTLFGFGFARRAGDPLARHADQHLPGGGARVRARPDRREPRQARLEARRGLAGGVRRAVRRGVRARARHRRPGLGPDRRSSSTRCRRCGRRCSSRTGSRAWSTPRAPTTRSPTCSRISPPGCPTPRARCWARRAPSSARCCRLVTLTFLSLFLLMERPPDHGLAVRVRVAGERAALAPGGRELDQGGLHEPDRQHRDLDRGRHRRRRLGLDLRPARSRSCWP